VDEYLLKTGKMKIKIAVLLVIMLSSVTIRAQETIDQVVAVVGNSPILKSDIEGQYVQMMSQNYYSNSVDLKCEILEELLFQKLLLNQAMIDSIEVTPKEVDTELNRRLGIFINQMGSEQKLEEYYNKSISEIRDEFRGIIKEQLLTQKMQGQLTTGIKVSPSQVRNYFNEIPADSLPIIPASYEYSQIVIFPELNEEQKKISYDKINELRERVVKGDSFSTLAILYSQDPGSASEGGELGFVSRTDLVPEFAEVAFSLTSPDVVSPIIETEFGFHILQLVERKGELVNVRHILIVPEIADSDVKKAKKDLENIYRLILADSITFEKAAATYSDDIDSKSNSGKAINPYSGNSKFLADQIDVNTLQIVKQLTPGQTSSVFETRDLRGKKIYKIVRLDRKVDEHIANLNDDFQEISEVALQREQLKKIKEWISNQIETTYIFIDDSYGNCTFKYADWNKKTK